VARKSATSCFISDGLIEAAMSAKSIAGSSDGSGIFVAATGVIEEPELGVGHSLLNRKERRT